MTTTYAQLESRNNAQADTITRINRENAALSRELEKAKARTEKQQWIIDQMRKEAGTPVAKAIQQAEKLFEELTG